MSRPAARAVDLPALRRYAIARSLFPPTTLPRAIERLGFVQADPIRAPARAQDLTLRHRVAGYRAGDLERRYPRLAVDEDCLVNYGFLPRRHLALMHPREARRPWDEATRQRADAVLAFVRERGPTHPREVVAAFDHGRIQGYWGGMTQASTRLLEDLHYRGLLRVVRRDGGTRVYQAADHPERDDSPQARLACAEALVDLVVRTYAPVPASSLVYLVRLLRYGAPHLEAECRQVLAQAAEAYGGARIDGVAWIWPPDENPASARHRPDEAVRLLAPFDPVVWDRRRFELFWGWTYRFEAYTPAAQRKLGYYALPLLWHERVIGWATVDRPGRDVRVQPGFADGRQPRDAAFSDALDAEIERLRAFLGADTPD